MVFNSKQNAAKMKNAPEAPEVKNQLDDPNNTAASAPTDALNNTDASNPAPTDGSDASAASAGTATTDNSKINVANGSVEDLLKKDAPQLVRMRIRGNYNFLHPRSGKKVTDEFKDFKVDDWIKAQLAAGLVEVQTLDGKPLQLTDTELVEVE